VNDEMRGPVFETGAGAYLIEGGLSGGALPDCACEKKREPKVQAIQDILATIVILAILATLIAGSGGIGGAAAPAVLIALMLAFGLTTLAFPTNVAAAQVTPPACCVTEECGKPDLFRGGSRDSPQLEKIRINRAPPFEDDVPYRVLDPNILYGDIPTGTTCIDASPRLKAGIEVIASVAGASLDVNPDNLSTFKGQFAWKVAPLLFIVRPHSARLN
jgi:hypothetical protein